MRLDEQHAYDERVYNPVAIKEHLVPEFQFRKFVRLVSKQKGQISGFYALIDFTAFLVPEDFPPERVQAIKKVAYKVHVAYHEDPPIATMVQLMKAQKISPKIIAENLGIRRENVYYYMNREMEIPAQCMLTYGEYNIMLDFMDAWNKIKNMGELDYV